MPCLLIGLKSDLTVLRTVDPQLGHLIGNLFGVQAIEVDNFTVAGVQLLQQYFIQFIYSDRKVLLSNQQQGSSTTAKRNNAIEPPTCEATAKPAIPTVTISPPSPPAPRDTKSNSTAADEESIETIIDQLLNSHHHHQDEHGVTIFLTVFRKFMKPSQLAQILIQRFEFDLINQEHHFKSATTAEKFILPTTRQERIRSFLCIWLSHYWGDFKSSVVRRIMLDFLDSVSRYPELRPICDVLMPLAMREPAIKDKDASWGMVDQESTKNNTTTSNKKDSGYCDSFQWLDAQLVAEEQEQAEHYQSKSLKRAASTNSHIPVAFKSIVSTLNKRNSTPVSVLIQQQQQLKRNTETLPRKSSMDRSAVFGGGIIPVHYDQPTMMYEHTTQQFDILKTLTPIKLAEQLTWIDQELFRKIQPRDFLRHASSSSFNQQSSSSKRRRKSATASKENPVLASIEHFNFVSGWIASLIVSQACMDKRIYVFEFCLQVAVHARQLNNFNTLMAVLAGINSAAVLRLKQTRLAVQCKNKALYDQYLALETLMSSER